MGKHIRVKSSGNWSQRFESMSLRKSRRSNQNRKTVADIQFLSLPKRSYRIKYLLYWKHVIVNQRYFYQTLQLFVQAVFNKTNLMLNISGEVIESGDWHLDRSYISGYQLVTFIREKEYLTKHVLSQPNNNSDISQLKPVLGSSLQDLRHAWTPTDFYTGHSWEQKGCVNMKQLSLKKTYMGHDCIRFPNYMCVESMHAIILLTKILFQLVSWYQRKRLFRTCSTPGNNVCASTNHFTHSQHGLLTRM